MARINQEPLTVTKAIGFVRRLNIALVDVDDPSSWQLAELRYVPDDNDEYYRIIFFDETIYESGDPFDEAEVVRMVKGILNTIAINSVLQKKGLEEYIVKLKKKGKKKHVGKSKKRDSRRSK